MSRLSFRVSLPPERDPEHDEDGPGLAAAVLAIIAFYAGLITLLYFSFKWFLHP